MQTLEAEEISDSSTSPNDILVNEYENSTLFEQPKLNRKRRSEICPILDHRRRRVTFFKRHRGLIKKAHDLATLCDVEVAILLKDITQNRILHYSSAFEQGSELISESAWYKKIVNGIQGFSLYKVRLNNGTLSKILGTYDRGSVEDADVDDVSYIPQDANVALTLPSIASTLHPINVCPVIHTKNISVSTLCMMNAPQLPPREWYCQSVTHSSFLALDEHGNVLLSRDLYSAKWVIRHVGPKDLFAYIYSSHFDRGLSMSKRECVLSCTPDRFLFFYYGTYWVIINEDKAVNVLPDGRIGLQGAVDRSAMFRLIQG